MILIDFVDWRRDRKPCIQSGACTMRSCMRHVLLPLTPLASEVTTTVTGFGRDITVRQTLNLGYWCRSAYQWEAAGGAVISYQRNHLISFAQQSWHSCISMCLRVGWYSLNHQRIRITVVETLNWCLCLCSSFTPCCQISKEWLSCCLAQSP